MLSTLSGQVSDAPPEDEEMEGSGMFEESGMFEGSGLFEGSGEEVEGSGMSDDEEDEEEGPVYFFLEESTGYMQPTMSFLSILHTVISFICIIGYNCLKVHLTNATIYYVVITPPLFVFFVEYLDKEEK